ncbi:MAG: peptidase domain-containing ABC transporter, partial [Vulcanococcus sp.]
VLIRGDAGMLGSLSIGLILVFAFRSALNLLQGHMVGYFGQKLQLQMILHYGQRLLGLPINYFETHRSGEVVSRISDIRHLNSLLSDIVLGLPSQFCIAMVSILLMWTYNGWLTLAALGCYLVVLICNASFIPAQARLAKQLLVKGAENQGYLVELFRGISVLKCSEGTPQAWQEYQNNFGKLANASWTSLRLNLKQETVTALLGSVTTVGLLWYGSSFVISNQLSIGQLLAFSAMGANVFGFLAAISGISQEVLKADVVIKRMSDVLERKPEAAEHRGLHHVELKPDVEILCDQISFHHPGRRPLLNKLSLQIPGGVTTALIGESGCGKSTLSKLIAGLQNPQSGSIHYGPYSSSDLDMDCLRSQVVLVPQDSVMFNRTIFENFSFAHPGVSFEEVVRACQISLADDFIRELPEGYQTVIGEFGTNLSGGQRQRLAMARALINNPPVLILDESTSALDPVLESRVVDRLLEFRKGKTTLVISHRPSMILRADWVVVLEAGRVREQNTPLALRETFHLAPFLQAA